MKRIITFVALLLVSGAASATLVWENNFNSPNTFFDPSPNPVDMHNGRDDAWLGAGTSSIFTGGASDVLQLLSAGSSQTRGLVRALNEGLSSKVDTTGDASKYYKFTFDLVSTYNNADVHLQFLDGTRDADGSNPETNSYGIDLLSAAGADLTHTSIGSGSVANIIDNTYTKADEGTGITAIFDWDGTGDLVMVWDTTSSAGNNIGTIYTRLDNFKLEVIPEPATLGLVALFGGSVIFIRRRFML